MKKMINNIFEMKNNFKTHPNIKNLNSKFLISILNGWKKENFVEYFGEKILPFFVDQKKGEYLAFPDTGKEEMGFLGDFINIVFNPNTITYFNGSPMGTIIEIDTILKIRKLLNLKNSEFNIEKGLLNLGGVWTLGGTMANHLAINDHIKKFISANGKFSKKIALIKEETHYSVFNGIENALQSHNSIMYIDINNIENYFKINNKRMAFVITTFGTSATTSKNNAIKIIEQCNKYNIPLHIDAAQGFVDFILKPIDWQKYNNDITISLDFHKALFLNYGSSYLISRNSDFFNYKIKSNSLDLAALNNLVGSKSCNSLKTWLFLKNTTKEKITKMIISGRESLKKLLNKMTFEDEMVKVYLLTKDFMHKALILIDSKKSLFSNDKLTEKIMRNMLTKEEIVFDLISIPWKNDFRLALGISTSQKLSDKLIENISCAFKKSVIQSIRNPDENKDNDDLIKKFISPANWQNTNFKEKMLEKVSYYSKKGFQIQGSIILWLLHNDYYRLPNDLDLILVNKNFKNFNEKFNYFKQNALYKPEYIYDYFNWVEDGISVDILLNVEMELEDLVKAEVEYNGKKYLINHVSIDESFFSKIFNIIYKITGNQELEEVYLKENTIKDIEFIFAKYSFKNVDLVPIIKKEFKNVYSIYFENIYKNINQEKKNEIIALFKNEELKKIITGIIDNLIKYKNYKPKIESKMFFNWKKQEKNKKIEK